MIHARIEWETSEQNFLATKNLETGGLVQAAIDNAVIRYGMQYAPMLTGTLAKSPYSASPPGSGRVIYNTPYARYLYYDVVYGPNIPIYDDNSGEPTRFFSPPGQIKHPKSPEQSFKFNTGYNPLAGAFWFERMKAAHIDDIREEAMRVANTE